MRPEIREQLVRKAVRPGNWAEVVNLMARVAAIVPAIMAAEIAVAMAAGPATVVVPATAGRNSRDRIPVMCISSTLDGGR